MGRESITPEGEREDDMMASGCIVALDCPVCGDIVWEDEWDILGDDIIHASCRAEYLKRRFHLSEEQFSRLHGTQLLRAEIGALLQAAEEHKKWVELRVEELAQKIEGLKGKEMISP